MRFFSTLTVLLLGLCVLVPQVAQAQSGRCFAPKAQMRFKPVVEKTQYNISESAFSINHATGGPAGGGLVLGLAYAPLLFDYEALFQVTKNAKGYCVSFDKMKMYWRAKPFVLISEEFPRGSCEFNAVLFHENKHVRTLKKVHAKHAAGFKRHVDASLERVGVIGPVSRGEIAAAQKDLQNEFNRLLDVYVEEARIELAKAQNRVDSPSEYDRVNGECEDWAGRLRLE